MQKKTIGLVLAAVLIVAVSAGGYYQYRSNAATGDAQAGKTGAPGGMGGPGGGRRAGMNPVSTAVARNGEMDISINAIGTVTARNTAVVRARVDGLLQRLTFREGQKVKAGDVLAEIDPRPFQAALDQVNGQLVRDQAQLTNAVIDQQRYQMLLARDSVSRQQLDTQDALVRQLQGAVQTSRAQVESAKLQLSFTRITAPISGRLGLRQVDVGNMVRASDTNGVVVITETQPINVVFAIPADQLGAVLQRVQAGAGLPVEAFDREGRKKLAVGKLLSIDNQIDTTTGTVKLKAEFENADDALFPNQFVNARLKVDTRKDVVLIPPAAIQRGTQGSYVYVLNAEEKTVSLRPVTLGPSTADIVAIDKGLSSGEIVVVDGLDKLRPGAKVEPIQLGGGVPGESRAKPEGKRETAREGKEEAKTAGKPEAMPVDSAKAVAISAPAALRSAPIAAPPAPNGMPAGNSSAATAQAATGSGQGGSRPEWFDKLPSEIREKALAMPQEERREFLRAYMQKKREERERQAAAE